jgi:hypothetical protein
LMNIIKMGFREMRWGGGGCVGLIDMTHDRDKW